MQSLQTHTQKFERDKTREKVNVIIEQSYDGQNLAGQCSEGGSGKWNRQRGRSPPRRPRPQWNEHILGGNQSTAEC